MFAVIMLVIREISLAFGKQVLFNAIGGTIQANDRIGLVGANGTGKSTLFKILMDEHEIDSGGVEKPDYFTIGYLPQDGIEVKGRSLYAEVESAFGDVLALQKNIDEATERMYEMDPASEEYYDLIDQMGAWEEQLEYHEPEKMRSRIERILHGLGFADSDFERDTGEFSGGWQMRIALAKLLLQSPSLLLLDEPTNHLDIVSQYWVEQYLSHYKGALMVISHDRAFLDVVTNKIFELKHGELRSY